MLLKRRREGYLALLWSARQDSPELERTLLGHQGTVPCVAVTPGGDLAISGSQDCTLKIWDLELGAEVRTLGGHDALEVLDEVLQHVSLAHVVPPLGDSDS